MKIKDVLQRDPSTHPLVNQGQARIADKSNEKVFEELRGELSTFVCEGQYADGIQRILSSFLANLAQTSQKAAWVSGFFGSGKSHLLKMACHLWQDTKFPDGATARSLVPSMPDELRSLLRELDTAGKRAGGLLAAAGALPSGTTDHVRLTILAVLLRGVGLPDQFPQAQFCLWLHDQGWFDKVKGAVEGAGKQWQSELNNLYVSKHIANALLACDPGFASTEAEARNTLKAQFPPRNTDVTTEEFLTAIKRVLKLVGRDGRTPLTLLVLDEVQQYIGDSNDRSTLVTEVTEALSKQLDSRVIVVASGQSALTQVRLLHKLMHRYQISVQLSDQDVETVVRKVLLQKKAASISTVKDFLEKHGGEVSRQLQGTRIGESAQDREVIVDDYPLLPVRRRFWEHCFRAVDAAGTHSQLRSQLRIIHDAVARLCDRGLGATVPGDELFEALAPEMVNTGVLLREINERIINLSKDGTDKGKLARRICGLVFLISRLPREAGADIGVRASKEHIADLLVDDLLADNGKLRSSVEVVLEDLASSGALMKVGDEYRLQTKEGAEWDAEFRRRQGKLANDDADIQIRRDQQIYAEADRVIRSVKVVQGAAKEARQVVVSRDQTPPTGNGESVPLWIRDGWSASEKELLDAARAAGTDSPTVFVFLPRQAADELRKLIVDAEAAQQTIDAKGTPTTREGEEAKHSMESRRNAAVRQRDELIKQIVANAKVFQGGGSELLQATIEERVREATNSALVRLFPRFKEADSAAWETVIKRAKEGADQPLAPVGHTVATEEHAVCKAVVSTIGAGKLGGDVRKVLRASPYGWPQDAIDAALIALHRTQHISATLNGTVLTSGQLDQNKISKAEFRVEKITLSVTEKLAIRKVFQALGVSCKAGEELIKAPVFLDQLAALGRATGGDAPLPAPASVSDIEDIRARVGNDQLAGIRDNAATLEKHIAEWSKTKALVDARRPTWELFERLAKHAHGLAAAADLLNQVEAVRSHRLLLEATDPVAPLRSGLADALRKALFEAHGAYETAFGKGMASLESSTLWPRLSESDRSSILANAGLSPAAQLSVPSDESLASALDAKSLSSRHAEVDAIPGRVQKALEQAAKLLEPKVRPVAIERSTLATEADVDAWLERQKKALVAAIKDGPVLVS
ncbi:BREX system P-loop protein BrxC [Corallococcus sp. AB018]|uniref:BREX system P-loop protein BrxC n=1 Tax=Corallococcus sp. AB018 TaxID=2316715 RepID=UPI000F881597|nr:BREX system P-loop protein BrxC [Corallococcus sp. AB018]RUO91232.1 BREX system P-loop protein BrxC [Corallococcus sp. AB018]